MSTKKSASSDGENLIAWHSAFHAPERAQPIENYRLFDSTQGLAILPNLHSPHLLISSLLTVECQRYNVVNSAF
jgi:hypothetical protein